MGIAEESVVEADSLTETDDEEILNIRSLYRQLYDKYSEQTQAEAKEVIEAGGLFILGTERHESRRIDNQLRGRSGRQGDIGHSRFYLSLEDDLMRLFGGERMTSLMNTLRIDEDMPIENRMLTGAIENAQKKVENMNFERRKRVLEYDDVINKQRETIYAQRQKVLSGEDVADNMSGHDRGRHPGFGAKVHARPCGRLESGRAETGVCGGGFLGQDDLKYTDEEKKRLTREQLVDGTSPVKRRPCTRKRRRPTALNSCASLSALSCCALWTAIGLTRSTPWRTSNRASGCAHSRRWTRSWHTAKRAWTCTPR